MKKIAVKIFGLCACLALFIPLLLSGCARSSAKDRQNAKLYHFDLVEYEGKECYYISNYLGDLEQITIPDTYKKKQVVSISPQAFLNNENITKVTIGKNIRTIGLQAFAGNVNLKELTFENDSKLEYIAEKAFYCTNITGSLVIPETVKQIGGSAFENCAQITNLTIGADINIKPSAFKNCYNIEKITITNGTVDDISMLVTNLAIFDTISEHKGNIYIEIDERLRSTLQDTIEALGFSFVK